VNDTAGGVLVRSDQTRDRGTVVPEAEAVMISAQRQRAQVES
jgi:hypothetical protein